MNPAIMHSTADDDDDDADRAVCAPFRQGSSALCSTPMNKIV